MWLSADTFWTETASRGNFIRSFVFKKKKIPGHCAPVHKRPVILAASAAYANHLTADDCGPWRWLRWQNTGLIWYTHGCIGARLGCSSRRSWTWKTCCGTRLRHASHTPFLVPPALNVVHFLLCFAFWQLWLCVSKTKQEGGGEGVSAMRGIRLFAWTFALVPVFKVWQRSWHNSYECFERGGKCTPWRQLFIDLDLLIRCESQRRDHSPKPCCHPSTMISWPWYWCGSQVLMWQIITALYSSIFFIFFYILFWMGNVMNGFIVFSSTHLPTPFIFWVRRIQVSLMDGMLLICLSGLTTCDFGSISTRSLWFRNYSVNFKHPGPCICIYRF